jgi:UDP-N-acetylglucosamine--N-acetylmuramyl-(pentapeptide) pyrophosphoryl-undecaprenol N-acetylglucosamine transferase
MRLLIAGGGTGGHIYPALAVANALRRRPGAADLDWVGGRRGLEDGIVPAAGIPLRRLLLRSLRSVGRDIHLVLDPVRLGLSVPQALWWLVRRRPAAISRPAATSRSRC